MAGRPKKENNGAVKEAVYTKEAMLLMAKYKHRVDLLGALLEDGKEYTEKEADAKLKEFLDN